MWANVSITAVNSTITSISCRVSSATIMEDVSVELIACHRSNVSAVLLKIAPEKSSLLCCFSFP